MQASYHDRLEQAKLLSGTSGEVEDEAERLRNPGGDFAAAREFIFLKV
jgi:nuclear GTP-binding protein